MYNSPSKKNSSLQKITRFSYLYIPLLTKHVLHLLFCLICGLVIYSFEIFFFNFSIHSILDSTKMLVFAYFSTGDDFIRILIKELQDKILTSVMLSL